MPREGKEERREGGKEGRKDGGNDGRREGRKEGRREGGTKTTPDLPLDGLLSILLAIFNGLKLTVFQIFLQSISTTNVVKQSCSSGT